MEKKEIFKNYLRPLAFLKITVIVGCYHNKLLKHMAKTNDQTVSREKPNIRDCKEAYTCYAVAKRLEKLFPVITWEADHMPQVNWHLCVELVS